MSEIETLDFQSADQKRKAAEAAEESAVAESLAKAGHQFKYRVAVCMPTHNIIPATFANDLGMMACVTGQVAKQFDILYAQYFLQGTLLPAMRQNLARMAIENGMTHILWLDTDMRFPKDLLLRLLDNDVDIVGANYVTRKVPIKPTAHLRVGYKDPETQEEFPHKLLWPNYADDDPKLIEVDALGFGAVLTRTSVFQNLPEPWFHTGWNQQGGAHYGEDIHFCLHARRHGYKVYVDRSLDDMIGHSGQYDFELLPAYNAFMARAAAEAEFEQEKSRIILPE